MAGRRRDPGLLKITLCLALIGPLAVAAAVVGVRSGALDWRTGYQTIALAYAWGAAIIGVVGSLAGIAYAFATGRANWLWMPVLGLVLSGLVVGLGWRERQAIAAHPPVHEVSTDWEDRPGFSATVMAARRRTGAAPLAQTGDPAACPGAVAVPSQMAPDAVRTALEEAGVQVIGVAPFRAEGVKTGFWFGFTQDVSVRIRPGQTDVRVAGRQDRADGGAACRLTTRIVQALQARA